MLILEFIAYNITHKSFILTGYSLLLYLHSIIYNIYILYIYIWHIYIYIYIPTSISTHTKKLRWSYSISTPNIKKI